MPGAASAAPNCAQAARVRRDRPVSRAGSAAMSVAIVDYGSGNLHSAAKAFERAAREAGLGQPIVVTSDPEVVATRRPRRAAGRRRLRRLPARPRRGRRHGRRRWTRRCAARGRPFLGICVGMQLMAERGREYEVTEGLGWIAGEVDRIAPRDPGLKIPHMGWNTLNVARPHPLLDGLTGRPAGPARLFRALVSAQAGAARRSGGRGRLRRRRHRDRRRATTWSARNSIPRRARSSVSR